ncbi:hypothetical protein HRbin36_02416 [bacterium HR36]|nr:hypothetical protein HRbin36_02416 [bacterium HR36]
MQPWIWTSAWALAGLAAVPALVAIYWLRQRYRQHPVSTLLFWRDLPELRDAGMRWEKLQLPLLFFVELLAILALVGAAVGLHLLVPEHTRPLVVILDDSLSMQAGRPSARERAERELRQLLRQRRFAWVRLLLAGPTPQWLGQAVTDYQELEPMLQDWKCLEPAAAIARALATAREWAGKEALLLVLTDTPPAEDVEAGWIEWWAFGTANENLAIVHALRTAGSQRDRVVLEVANFSLRPQTTTLTLRAADSVLHTTWLSLQAGETQTLHYTLPPQATLVEAALPEDALELDNRAWLVRQPEASVQVGIELAPGRLRAALEKALRAVPHVVFNEQAPHVLITDRPARRPSARTWLVQLLLEKEGEAFSGPFLLDQRHPLCEGLSLQDVVWGARREPLEGAPIITVGDVPLVSEQSRSLSRRHLRVRLVPDLTTWPNSPDWPIFWANLIHWRRSEFSGPTSAHGRLGEIMRVHMDPHTAATAGADSKSVVICRQPDGGEERFVSQHGLAFIPLRQLGPHEIIAGEQRWPLAVNMVNRAESDLRSCKQGRWGQWLNDEILRRNYRETSWGFLLAVLVLLGIHSWLLWHGRGRLHRELASSSHQ